MHILFLTQILPYPLDTGSKVRAYNVLRHLACSHAVTLVSFVRPTDTQAMTDHLRRWCKAVHTVPIPRSRIRDAFYLLESLVTGKPFLVTRNWISSMAHLVSDLISKGCFDIIHADQLAMAPYALQARIASRSLRAPVPRLVLDQHDAVHLVPARLADKERNRSRRVLLALEARKMARYEVETCRRFDRTVWVTRQDCEAVQRWGSDALPWQLHSTVIPICVDPQETPVVARKRNARRVTFLGGLHYPPNAQGVLWFAEGVFPQVLIQSPDAVLTVIGSRPSKEILTLQSRCSNVQVTGYVKEIAPYLEETAVFLVPLLAGGGMRVKILDAWARGIPIVSTTVGAEGIETRPGENILIADTPGDFAQATVRLLQDPDAGRQMAEAGRRWVESHYDWRQVYRMWDQVYTGLRRT